MYNTQYQSAPQPAYHNPYSQTATFESAKVHEDSLPAMPSWDNAASRQVEVIEDAKPESHELEKLNPNGRTNSPPSAVNAGYAAPKPVRPGGGGSPYTETDSFLGSQSTGVMHADSHTGYRGAAPDPGQVGYGYQNQRPGYNASNQNFNSRSDFQSNSDFNRGGQGQDRFYDQRPSYDRQYSNHSQPPPAYGHQQQHSSPVYSGTTAHEQEPPNRYQAYSPTYGNDQRRPVNGSWKDI